MRAVIYARVSSTGERQSTERQIADLTNYAHQNSVTICNVYQEHISGSAKNKERKALAEAVQYCRENGVDMILITEFSRLGRNIFELCETIKSLQEHRINLISIKEQFRLLDEKKELTTYAPIVIAVLSICAQLERDNITHRLSSGRAQYILRGGICGRPKGSVKSMERKKSQYRGVLKRLANAEKIRDIATLEGVGISTVQRLKKVFFPSNTARNPPKKT